MAKQPQFNKMTEHQLRPFVVACQHIFITMLWVWLKVCFRRFVVRGRENLPPRKDSYIVVSNHTSDIDPPVMAVAIRYRPIAFMAKQELFKSWWKGRYYYFMGTFAVNRDKPEMATIKSAMTVLKTNPWVLGIFPEGTRSQDGTLGEVKKGAVSLAKTAKVPILPMAIVRRGADRKDVYVQIGHMIPYEAASTAEELAAQVQQTLSGLVEQANRME